MLFVISFTFIDRQNFLTFFMWQLFHLPEFSFDGTGTFSHYLFQLITGILQILLYFFK